MANYSKYKNLELPISTDKYSIGVFNKNNQIIDEELYNLDIKTEELNKEVETLKSNIKETKNDLSTHVINNNVHVKEEERIHWNNASLGMQIDGTTVYLDKKDGKYGINTDPERGADTFVPFKSDENDEKDDGDNEKENKISQNYIFNWSGGCQTNSLSCNSYIPIPYGAKKLKINNLLITFSKATTSAPNSTLYLRIYGVTTDSQQVDFKETISAYVSGSNSNLVSSKKENEEIILSDYGEFDSILIICTKSSASGTVYPYNFSAYGNISFE